MTITIIGIHGLANKPKAEILSKWWLQSINEGLKVNQNIVNPDIDFKMVYWADLLYSAQQHNREYFDFDAFYNKEPYIKAKPNKLNAHQESWLDFLRHTSINLAGNIFSFTTKSDLLAKILNFLVGKFLRDLSLYYNPNRKLLNRHGKPEQASRVLQNELKTELLKHKYKKKLVLIAHSMGSIIAYDVLRDLGRSENQFDIEHFITIGSPLGLPYVKKNIEIRRKKYSKLKDKPTTLRTPTILTKSWHNFADKRDPVSLDAQLRDEFEMNEHGIRVIDDLVTNDYQGLYGKPNPHKSYGYLRTPEVSKHLANIIRFG